jgi:hypothetical protein
VALNVVPSNLVRFATQHHGVAGVIRTDSAVDEPFLAELPEAYGPAGAALTTALADFASALHGAGDDIASDYDQMGKAVQTGAHTINTTDESSAKDFTSLTPSERM